MFSDSSIAAAVSRVRSTLDQSITQKYGPNAEAVDALMRIHGVSEPNFDFIAMTEDFLSQSVSDISIDANANKNEVSVVGSLCEVVNPVNKLVGMRHLYRTMKALYGEAEAQRLSGEMYDFSLAIADATKILLPYCFSLDTSKLVSTGRDFGVLPSAPPKRLSSYIAALNETVHQISNHTAGALAVGSFFFDVAHVLMYREDISLGMLRHDAGIRKYVENCFQNFVHSVNHLSRNALESPFSNVSVFDRVKLMTFLSDDNMGWLFAGTDKEYVADYIGELQRIFLDFMDRGDPLNGGRNFRFPVVTANISKEERDGEVILLDEDFIAELSRREVYRYNILVSEGTKVASCCRLLNNFELLELGGQMNSFGGAGVSLGSHRVVTINFNRIALEADSRADYLRRLEARTEDAAKILHAHRALLKDMADRGLHPFMSNGWLRLDRMFSTFGVLGIVEAGETLTARFGPNGDDIADSLRLLNAKAREITIGTGNIFNIEQIPGESMAPRLAQADRLLFGEDAVPYRLYSNQFVPLWQDATLFERMREDGRYNQLFTGGGIVHFNLGEKVTEQQAMALIQYAAKVGCEHFALNPVYSECADGHNSFGKHAACPVCGGEIVEYYTRVVGFFVPVSAFNTVRREWEFPRREFVAAD